MAQTLYGASISEQAPTQTRSLSSIMNLRLALGLSVLLGTIIFFVAVSWDIQWHSYIGRDRTLIPPHVMILCGVAISGLAALAVVLIETIGVRHAPSLARYSSAFVGGFSGPLGAYIAGFGALNTAIAFVLDSYWHALYGIDVAIWAPFHVMMLVGMVITGLGAAYMLVSVARIAEQIGKRGKMRAGYIGACAAFSAIITILPILIIDSLNNPQGYIALPGMKLNDFPALAGLACTWVLVAAVSAIPWRWVASMVSGITILIVLIMATFVPWAMDFLMAEEHLSYRAVASTRLDPHLPIIAVEWPLTATFLAAVLIDLVIVVARRKGWSQRRLTLTLACVALPVCVPLMPIIPGLVLGIGQVTGGVGLLLSMALGLLGTLLGSWFGHHVGEAMRTGR
ncbi:MAG TPA: hypothetical protein VKR06_42385 [Ktedonosporobacter sp.]|nr:hypothetical protein [Ktedonosporobacter sp.]